jgi:hypothetical protein
MAMAECEQKKPAAGKGVTAAGQWSRKYFLALNSIRARCARGAPVCAAWHPHGGA